MSDTSTFEFPLKEDEFKLFGVTAEQALHMTDDIFMGVANSYDLTVTQTSPGFNVDIKDVGNGKISGGKQYGTSLDSDNNLIYSENPSYHLVFSEGNGLNAGCAGMYTSLEPVNNQINSLLTLRYGEGYANEYAKGYINPDITYSDLLNMLKYDEFKKRGVKSVVYSPTDEAYTIKGNNGSSEYNLCIEENTIPSVEKELQRIFIDKRGYRFDTQLNRNVYSYVMYTFWFDKTSNKLYEMDEQLNIFLY